MKRIIEILRGWARQLKQQLLTLHFAVRDPQTPWYAKALALLVLCYALSPIDLIPDFIPVLGYLDDLILVPIGIALTLAMIPPEARERARAQAASATVRLPKSRIGLVLIVAIWVLSGFAFAVWYAGYF